MEKKSIFIEKGTFVTVHIMGNDYEDKNKKGWLYSASNPISYSFIAQMHGPVFHDPGLDIRMERGNHEYGMIAPKIIVNKGILIKAIKDCINTPSGVVPDVVCDIFPDIKF